VGFSVSAYQSHLFNAVLAERLLGLDRVLAGDLAFLHDTGRIVPVRDAGAEQPRAERFLLSATGPIVGHTMAEPAEEAAAIERRILAVEGVRVADLPRSGPLKCVGGRRPLRFQPSDSLVETGEDDLGAFLELRFTLPRGCYATVLLREVCKDALRERSGSPDGRQPDEPSAEASEPAEGARESRGEGESW
jgi:tRNA pseudouridine13 synthase